MLFLLFPSLYFIVFVATGVDETPKGPKLKKEERSGGGLVVGKAANGKMIADFKNVVPKMVARGVSIKTSKCLIKFE